VIALEARVRDQGGTIGGEVRHLEDIETSARLRVAPVRTDTRQPWDSPLYYIKRGFGSLIQTVAGYLIFAFLGLLTVYFFRGHLETVSDTISYSFGRSFLAGLAAQILFFPVLLVLIVLVLTLLAVPFYILGFGLAALLGYLAVAHAVGEHVTRRRFPSWPARLRRSNSYYYIFNGLAILLALFAAAAVAQMGGALLGWAHGLLIAAACITTWVAASAGLGAVLLSRAGTRRDFARPREVPDLTVDLDREPEPRAFEGEEDLGGEGGSEDDPQDRGPGGAEDEG
jgi:MFS family permease